MLRRVLLGLLAAEPRYGYELKAVFERFLGGTWPLNIGQIYATLSKLEREGLVESQVVPQELVPDRKVYAVTPAGRAELDRWAGEPDDGPVRLRDEFFLKIAVRSLTDGREAVELIRRQRDAHLAAMAEMQLASQDPDLHPATALLLEGALLRLEADLRWLDHCEDQVKSWEAR
ncbi:MAG TPA: PadR family transcriptional regulator [Acidimicrobiales bacterium]|jgi:DNA-binding PadR family transcriptional regulator